MKSAQSDRMENAQYSRGCVAWVGWGNEILSLFLVILEMEFEKGSSVLRERQTGVLSWELAA